MVTNGSPGSTLLLSWDNDCNSTRHFLCLHLFHSKPPPSTPPDKWIREHNLSLLFPYPVNSRTDLSLTYGLSQLYRCSNITGIFRFRVEYYLSYIALLLINFKKILQHPKDAYQARKGVKELLLNFYWIIQLLIMYRVNIQIDAAGHITTSIQLQEQMHIKFESNSAHKLIQLNPCYN